VDCGTLCTVERQKARRAQQRASSQCRGVRRPPKSTSADYATSSPTSSAGVCSTSADQAAALAIGLGPQFNWLENKIHTMQAGYTFFAFPANKLHLLQVAVV